MVAEGMSIEQLDGAFGAVVRDVSLSAVEPGAPAVAAIREALVEFGLLVFPDQHLDRGEQDAFALCFGELEFTATPLTNIRRDGSVRDPDHDLVKSLRGNEGWHHDSTYMSVQALGAVFSAEIIPTEGGDTGFADTQAAYAGLDVATRDRIADLSAYHSRRHSMERAGLHIAEDDAGTLKLYGYDDTDPPLRPLVKQHPESGRTCLTIGQHAYGIPGLDPDESADLLGLLDGRATVPECTYFHRWTVGDTVLWDNRRLLHRATPHDPTAPRRMWHTRIAGDPATESGLAV
jgi:alpha-ketoglutarate-dependent taurine dioxygenase